MIFDNRKVVSIEEAKRQVEIVARRIALLHIAYANVLVEEFGEEIGRKFVLKAIKNYGISIAEKIKKGKPDLPEYGVHERIEWINLGEEKRVRVYGCVLAKEWMEQGKNKLGRLYCYVDPAKSMSVNPLEKIGHSKAIPDGDEYCELTFRTTTEKERKDFADKEANWDYIDRVE